MSNKSSVDMIDNIGRPKNFHTYIALKLNSSTKSTELTEKLWLGFLRTLILPPLPSAPTAIKFPLLEPFVDVDSLFCPRLHHLPKYR